MIARIIGGLSKANVAIILAIVSDTTEETERNRAMVIIKTKGNRTSFIYLFSKGMDWCSIFVGFYIWTIAWCCM